jgi:hypothetical protein
MCLQITEICGGPSLQFVRPSAKKSGSPVWKWPRESERRHRSAARFEAWGPGDRKLLAQTGRSRDAAAATPMGQSTVDQVEMAGWGKIRADFSRQTDSGRRYGRSVPVSGSAMTLPAVPGRFLFATASEGSGPPQSPPSPHNPHVGNSAGPGSGSLKRVLRTS